MAILVGARVESLAPDPSPSLDRLHGGAELPRGDPAGGVCRLSLTSRRGSFVATPMTAGIPRNALFADPKDVGAGIHRAMKAGKDVVYLPWYWRFIMLVIRLIPERLFKRLGL